MPGLISSAASGKASAPKAPPRRRPPQSAAKVGPAPSSTTTSVAPPSPPPTEPTHAAVPSTRVSDASRAREPLGRIAEDQEESLPSVETLRESPAETIRKTAAPPTPEPSQSIAQRTRQRAERQDGRTPLARPEEHQLHNTHVVDDLSRESARVQDTPVSAKAQRPLRATGKRVLVEEPAGAPAPPAKRAKRAATRGNVAIQAAVQAEVGPDNISSGQAAVDDQQSTGTVLPRRSGRRAPAAAGVPSRSQAKAKSAATATDSRDEGEQPREAPAAEEQPAVAEAAPENEQSAPTKPKRKRRRKTVQTAAQNEDVEQPQQPAEVEDQDDPEKHQINPEALSMYHLSYDKVHGKMSERGKKMAEIDWDQVAQQRREEIEKITTNQLSAPADDIAPTTEGPDGTAERRSPPAPPNPLDGPQQYTFTLGEDGEINLDDSSLTYSREAEAIAAAHSDQPVVEENDLTRQFNRTTYINSHRRDPAERGLPMWKAKSDPWSEEETDRFYEALSMFGTDFFIISKMFKPKTRRMIKLKFVREERLDPGRVNDALLGKCKPMNLEHYARETGRDVSVFTKYEGVEHAQSIIEASLVEKETALTSQIQQEALERARVEKEKKLQKEREKKGQRKKGERRAKGKKGQATLGGEVGNDPGD